MKAVIVLVVCLAFTANAQPRSRRSLYTPHPYHHGYGLQAMQDGSKKIGLLMQNSAKLLSAWDTHTVEQTSAAIAAAVVNAAASVDQIIASASNEVVRQLENILNEAYAGLGNTANNLNVNMLNARDNAIAESENLAAFIDNVGSNLLDYVTDVMRQGATNAAQATVNGQARVNDIISNAVSAVVLAAQQVSNKVADEYNVGETKSINDFNQGATNVAADIFAGYAKAGNTLKAGQNAAAANKAREMSALAANTASTGAGLLAAHHPYYHHGLHY